MAESYRSGPAALRTYLFKPLLQDIQLSADGDDTSVHVTCVEHHDGNLYIGTSASEVLHFVSLPNEPGDALSEPSFILASRLEPTPVTSSGPALGVQQILVLPKSGKACILCNSVLTFHSLPELSPIGNIRQLNCAWVGGRDLDLDLIEAGHDEGDVLMVCIKKKVRMIRVREDVRKSRDIEFPGCLTAARRGRFACVADAHSYALLDLEKQQKIPLFPISSLDEDAAAATPTGKGPSEPFGASPERKAAGTDSPLHRRTGSALAERGHSRASSIGNLMSGLGVRHSDPNLSSPSGTRSVSASASPSRSSNARESPKISSPEKPLPPPPPTDGNESTGGEAGVDKRPSSPRRKSFEMLRPHILSPLPTEFLLSVGTATEEPGVGMFVNCDGDVLRGTLGFSQYPNSIVIDQIEASTTGHILAAFAKCTETTLECGIEVQHWDGTPGDGKEWLKLCEEELNDHTRLTRHARCGVSIAEAGGAVTIPEVGEKLRARRLEHSDHTAKSDAVSVMTAASDRARNAQEDEFSQRLSQAQGKVLAWTRNCVGWVVKTPTIVKLDAEIESIIENSSESRLDQAKLVEILKNIRNQEASSETEYLTLEYIRQKISVILFADLAVNRYDVNPQVDEKLLLEGGADPRLLLSMVPMLRKDIVEQDAGIWMFSGLVDFINTNYSATMITLDSDEVLARPEDYDVPSLLKRYLTAWRERKGVFGSIADEPQVFATVDGALLHTLLHQAQQASWGPEGSTLLRAELYAIVDNKIGCFDRAVDLLEEYHRLYVLSRLYQSRKMSSMVLATWRRILDGERDDGGEFTDGENEMRKYLTKIRDSSLIEDYGGWLAERNPQLGIFVFTDDNSRVKLPPGQVVSILRRRAPDAVKVYLEHLVFGKQNGQYANELISYYLDNVLTVLKTSEESKGVLAQSYETYRALEAPKPTYRQFITDNAIAASWWQDRLRLLELLGGTYGAGFSYDVPSILVRIEPFEESLVPESIILEGRQGRHTQALHLLTHGLGDFHTAINYCLLGGSSIFHPAMGSVDAEKAPTREEQSALFKHLLSEFLCIEDGGDRLECTSELLNRFGSWFDVEGVIGNMPDSWPVEAIASFVVSALRHIIEEKNESMMTKALSAAENVKVSTDLAEKCEALGPHIIPATDTPTSM